jgi:hypothetical protein
VLTEKKRGIGHALHTYNRFLLVFPQVFTVWIKTLNPTANYVVPDGLNSLRIRASSRVNDGIRMRGIEARIRSWVIINNMGNAPWPNRKDYFLEQIANTGFPWVSGCWIGSSTRD